MILDYLNTITSDGYKPVFPYDSTDRPVYASVDWLRCTSVKIDKFHDFVQKFGPMLRGHGFNFFDSGRGLHGYTNAWIIQFNGENCGYICADALNKMGGMFELTGMGCQILQARWDLWNMLAAGISEYGFSITRLDVCTDFKGPLWDKYSVNMLDVAEKVNSGMHKISRGRLPAVTLVGSWLDVVVNKLSPDEYIPKEQCGGGLTINVGSNKSVNTWCWYEKGKQLAGKNPERYDGSLDSWIRCERRFSRGQGRSRVVIPVDFMVCPDEAIVYNCPGVKRFIDDWLEFQKNNDIDLRPIGNREIDLERVGTFKYVALTKTARHVAMQSGRFFRSLVELGINPMDFVSRVINDDPTRGFDAEMCSDFTLDKCFGS